MLITRLAAVLAAFLLVGCGAQCAPCPRATSPSASCPTAPPTCLPERACAPCPTAPGASEPVALTGLGDRNSAPFALAGGDYKATWTMPGGDFCVHFSYLRSTTDELFRESVGRGEPPTGDTYLYGIEPGTYYVRTTSTPDCGEWTITIAGLP